VIFKAQQHVQQRHHLVREHKEEEMGAWRLETCGNRETSLDDDDDDDDEINRS